MGMITSRMGAYSNTMMMGTSGYVHFGTQMRRQMAQAQNLQQMQTIAQLQATGGGGGGGGGGGPMPGVGWFHFGQILTTFAPFAAVLGIALSGIFYAIKAEQYVLFLSMFVATFFGMFFILFHTQATMAGTLSGRNFWIALGGAALVSFPVAFMVYKGPEEEDDEEEDEIRVSVVPVQGSGGGGGLPPI